MKDIEAREALRRQWARISSVADEINLESESRVAGWRNAEVLAHLSVQPRLLGQFLATATSANSPHTPAMSLGENLMGTHTLAETIDALARQGARAGKLGFAQSAAVVDAALIAADLNAIVKRSSMEATCYRPSSLMPTRSRSRSMP
jgi:hypothetical protein